MAQIEKIESLKALINEDRLLSRIDYLEKQLAFHLSKVNNRQMSTDALQQVLIRATLRPRTSFEMQNFFSKQSAEDTLKQMLNTLRAEKFQAENEAKVFAAYLHLDLIN
jgi:hypothetical protein